MGTQQQLEKDFAASYEQYSDAIFRHCYFRLSDRDIALEIMQETFLRTWDYLKEGKEIDALKPFLYRVATNLIIEYYRKKKPVSLDAFLEVETHDEGMVEGLRDTESAERLIDQLDGERAMLAFKELSPKYRDVLVWRYVDGLSLKEIAELAQERENTVSVRIHRALIELKNTITTQ